MKDMLKQWVSTGLIYDFNANDDGSFTLQPAPGSAGGYIIEDSEIGYTVKAFTIDEDGETIFH